ncbi:MAG: hypothetical protein ACK46O_05445 [Flavobacteriia bacterium]
MNKFINALLLFVLFPTMLLTIFVGFDLPIEFLKTSGSQLSYRAEAFMALGIILLVINVRRSVRRWMGMRLTNQVNKFKWNEPMSSERKKRVVVYTLMEALVMGCVGTALYQVAQEAFIPSSAFWFGTADNLVFLIVGSTGNRFRGGITSKAVIIADRDVSLIYFSGLRKVSIQQDSIYFDYIKGLQLSFPMDCIPPSKKDEFFEILEQQIDRDKVFVTKNR